MSAMDDRFDLFTPLSANALDQAWLDHNKDSLIGRLADDKYWTNTITPLIDSGHMDALVNDRYMYPHRIGLFPGLSCMFYCGFCGRNKEASYDRSKVLDGLSIYKDLVSAAPKEGLGWKDRFRISGGQEPLTNPMIGELVSHCADQDYNIGIYTNGYMLTPSWLARQQGMLRLAYIRFSLYGFDEQSYAKTTKRSNAWPMVRKNMIDFANNHETRQIKLGMNWIILPGKSADYMSLLEALRSMQDEMDRPIDFLTVREDFSQDLVFIDRDERTRLIDIISQADSFVKRYMPNLKIDYGYALHPLTKGKVIGPLRMARHDQLDPKGLVQASVQIDVLGNIYAYHETAFLDRAGSDRFIIGNAKHGVEQEIRSHLSNNKGFRYLPSDTEMLDAYEHAVSLAVHAAKRDLANGFTRTLWQ